MVTSVGEIRSLGNTDRSIRNPFYGKIVVVMRHAEREDDYPGYTGSAMPNPDITALGYERSAAAALDVMEMDERCRPSLVITSPFIRCVHTAQTAATVWNNAELVYDYGIAEIHNERRIKGTGNKAPVLNIPSDVPCSKLTTKQPSWGESDLEAIARFRRSIEHAVRAYDGVHTVIGFVSHGDAISTAASMGLRATAGEEVVVYNVEFNGFVILGYDIDQADWILLSASGVEWFGAHESHMTLPAYLSKYTHRCQVPDEDVILVGAGESVGRCSTSIIINKEEESQDMGASSELHHGMATTERAPDPSQDLPTPVLQQHATNPVVASLAKDTREAAIECTSMDNSASSSRSLPCTFS